MAVQKRDAVADTVAALETKRELLASLGEDTSAIDAKLAEWRADIDPVEPAPPVENKVAPAAPEKATLPASDNAAAKPGKAAPTKATATKTEPAPAQVKTEETKAADGGPGNDN
ncbi:hypothetical protein [Mycobacteroides abscessus]|uniref:hypothetical protein n=1 Tax=Mycobacteroides abscessus TaxID=36809 RepID=UPI000929F73F|nr:hypothetical protein [Mycobacteroides abscessus]SIK47249.1 Uncharacterised protein [Mycobacteroides abscessus subsp. abscessus]